MFNTFEEAKYWVEHLHRFGDKLDLSRMTIACEMLDHPEKAFPSIHIAGTNGKGSTANYIKNILVHAGYKTGIYTSPYIVRFNERIAINQDDITDEDFLTYINHLYPVWEKYFNQYHEPITFFEVLTLIMFLYFRDQKVDIAVIEVGLGGLLDATNVITPLVSIITNINYDHMAQLGNSLESIAFNKLGIVKENGILLTTYAQAELNPIFKEMTEKRHAKMIHLNSNMISNPNPSIPTSFDYLGTHYELSLHGSYQIPNALLAIETAKILKDTYNYSITEEDIIFGLNHTLWPGRFEVFQDNIILDGAHNIGGVEALISSLKQTYPDKKVRCIISMMKDKEHDKVIHLLDDYVDEITFTEFDYPRRADASVLFAESHHPKKKMILDYKEAIDSIHLKEDEILLLTGSLYFMSAVRPYILTK